MAARVACEVFLILREKKKVHPASFSEKERGRFGSSLCTKKKKGLNRNGCVVGKGGGGGGGGEGVFAAFFFFNSHRASLPLSAGGGGKKKGTATARSMKKKEGEGRREQFCFTT